MVSLFPVPSRTSLGEKASEAGDSDDEEISFSDAAGTPPPHAKHRHQARADAVSEAFEKVLCPSSHCYLPSTVAQNLT